MGKKSVRKRFTHKKRHSDGVPTFSKNPDSKAEVDAKNDVISGDKELGNTSRYSDENSDKSKPQVIYDNKGETKVLNAEPTGGCINENEAACTSKFNQHSTTSAGSNVMEYACGESSTVTTSMAQKCFSSSVESVRHHNDKAQQFSSDEAKREVGRIESDVFSLHTAIEVSIDLLMQVKSKLKAFLPQRLIALACSEDIRVCFLSPHNNLSIQRTIVFGRNGGVELYVHRQQLSVDQLLSGVDPAVPLECSTVNYFVDRAVKICNKVREMEICCGFDDAKYKSAWSTCPFGRVDENPHDECRYTETFRSMSCARLVTPRKWRCSECSKLFHPLRRRTQSAAVDAPHAFTTNQYLSEQQKLRKLEDQQRELASGKKKIERLKAKMQNLIETLEGIEMSTLAIKGAISFLLEEGIDFINPRVFTQDPLEQHFGKLRAGQGGSNNPNYQQVLHRNRAIHNIGQLGMKRRKGNSSECAASVEVITDLLLKRKCKRGPKFSM